MTLVAAALLGGAGKATANQSSAVPEKAQMGNSETSEEEFVDWGFGLFIHWGPVAQIGREISWPVRDASEEFRKKYFSLYQTFDPVKFNPERWAKLAKGAGMQYVVFTTKHHAGFCMFDTEYTDYDIMHTPYGKDLTAHLAEAFRKEGIAVGWYYSPADWHYQYKTGMKGRYERGPAVAKYKKPYGTHGLTLLEYERRQIEELLTNYGEIDLMWYDGNGTGLKEHTWRVKPDVFIARSEIATPEQRLPSKPLGGPWETCMTMGRQWAYKPDDEYKSVTELVHNLVKIRAMGGNYLLNVGPKADGALPQPQVEILKGLAEWMDVNGEAIHGVRGWKTHREGDAWFTFKKDGSAVYAVLLEWPEGPELTMESLRRVPITGVRLLGAADKPEWSKSEEGLTVRLPTDRRPCRHAFTLKLTLDESEVPFWKPGTVTLEPGEATLEGDRIKVQDTPPGENIGFWVDPEERIHWLAQVRQRGVYRIRGEFGAASGPSALEVKVAGRPFSAEIPHTGTWADTRMIELGQVEFPESGVYHLLLEPSGPENWNPVNVHQVQLAPVQ